MNIHFGRWLNRLVWNLGVDPAATAVQKLGRESLALSERFGRAVFFLLATLSGAGEVGRRPQLLIVQLYRSGVLSLPLILVSALFVGMVLGFQGYHVLTDFGAESSLGVMVAASLTRELGPVVTALLFSGRAGSALTAEVGLMKATEQLDAMELMAVDPLKRVIAPRFFAGWLAVPLLTSIFTCVGIYGGYFIGVVILGVDEGAFWSQMKQVLTFREDIVNGLVKALLFGLLVTWIALFEGYEAEPTAEGVGRATTRSVVYAAFATLSADFVLTALMFGG